MKEISTARFVSGENGPIPVEAMDKEQLEALSRWLRETYMTELCRGKAVIQWDDNPTCRHQNGPAAEWRIPRQAHYSFNLIP